MIPFLVLAASGLVGAVLDARFRLLPNWLSIVLLVAGLVFAWTDGGWAAVAWHGAHAGVALVGGMILFALRIFGGGDAKYYAGMAAWFDLRSGFFLLGLTAVAGLFVVLAWFVGRRLVPPKDGVTPRRDIPYGIAIYVGAIASFALLHNVF